jgi:N-acetylmuramoyl-L-alanine amidase
VLLAALAAGCASGRGGAAGAPPGGDAGPAPADTAGALAAEGPPAIRVVYPPEGAALTASDSAFVFGDVRPADARVTVNGFPARRARGGGWIAWVPLQPGEFSFQIVAWPPAAADSADALGDPAREGAAPLTAVEWPVRVPGSIDEAWAGVLDTASVTPADTLELAPGDPVRLRFRGVPGLRAAAVLGGGLARAAFVEDRGGPDVARLTHGPADAAILPADPRASGGGAGAAPPSGWSWYRADLVLPRPEAAGSGASSPRVPGRRGARSEAEPGAESGPDWTFGAWAPLAIEIAGPVPDAGPAAPGERGGTPGREPPAGAAAEPAVDDGRAAAAARQPGALLRYELRAPVRLRDPHAIDVAVLDDDPEGAGTTDRTVVGRAAPDGVFFLFLPNGTRARTGRRVGGLRELRLDGQLSVWAPIGEVHPLPGGTPEPRSRVPVVRTVQGEDRTRVVIPLEAQLPFQVRQETDPVRYEITLFGARAAAEFVRHDAGDPLVRALRWNQPASDRFVLEVEVAGRQPWGWHAGYEGDDFVLEVRRPPPVRGGSVAGLRIVVDAGHAPEPGAVGPTGLPERDANLGVALDLARLLEDRGAEVVLTRDADTPNDLAPALLARAALPRDADADLLVSVHHNALPDGVNPFSSHGTSTFYYHPQSLPLARAVQRELVRELGLRDLGIGLANLAMVRPTWAPAVLTESAFMMIPEQERLLRSGEFRRREARAILRGIERFLEERTGSR